MLQTMIENALRLKELDKLIIKAIATSDVAQLANHIAEFNTSKKLIRSYALENPILNMQEIENPSARLIIQKVMSGEPLSVEQAMQGNAIEDFLKGELDENDIEKLGSDLFYSWFCDYEYIQGLYEIGALTLSCGAVPMNLSRFVDEARHCYTFQQYNAVYSLCRTILEVCIKDIATTYKILPKDKGNMKRLALRTPELCELINKLCDDFTEFESIRNKLHGVRRDTNYIIHGNRIVKKQETKEMLKKTLLVVHQLYECDANRKNRTTSR